VTIMRHHIFMQNIQVRKHYEIDTLRLYRGRLPPRAHSLVLEWADMHRNELRDNWRRAQRHQTLHSIEPLY